MTDELFATCWTSAGDTVPASADPRSPLPLRERIEAASAAGFRGFGLHSADLPAAERQYGLKGIRSLLDDNGIVDVELEGIPGWWTGEPAVEQRKHHVLTAAEALGAAHVKVTPDDHDRPWDLAACATRFATLAAQAEGVGARLGIEFLPWSNIKDVRDGLRFVEEAGHDNGGLVIDIWHVERNHTPLATLLEIPLNRVTSVELSDAAGEVVGTLLEDTIHRRRYCGEGVFDLAGFIAALRAIGWRGPWAIEILSAEHRVTPLREALVRAHETGRARLNGA
ncbi:sugar phosphate isomerase/epimerase [Lentzea atacamensis]|uniref:Sugar phosphate isomerase/epimerase n=1 Tax=Lentzea atacamensis TaxID=531938 RepID=A0A316HJ51_9PSEU|nr:sugar phosphate isomerase/epimerase family protein [Lentzea atacamensis]PWK80688.1 sugar phosphate isomerase/epimerase [Lentzea atacamensis]